jgi:hypothetical protein
MSARGLLFQWASTIKIQLSLLVYKVELIISLKINLFNAVYLAEKQQIPILVFGLTQSGLEPTIYRTRGEHANNYATNAVTM